MSEQETNKTKIQGSRRDEEISRLLSLRREIKERTPHFRRQESWRYVRIHDAWRKPKGVDSHMRLSFKGWPPLVKIGYRGPTASRGLHPSGFRDVIVRNLNDLNSLDPSGDAARIASGVGRRKKIELAKRAKELGIRLLNGRNLLIVQSVAEEPKEKKGSSKEKKRRSSDDKRKKGKSQVTKGSNKEE